MTSRRRPLYACDACGYESPRWFGRCARCQAYNTCIEQIAAPAPSRASATANVPVLLADLSEESALGGPRLPIPLQEFHRVLGGGIVPGSVILVGGDPGVGKSTLLLQTALLLAKQGLRALYVSAEESPHQVKGRAQRLQAKDAPLHLLAETDLDAIENHLLQMKPHIAIIDSIQTVGHPEVGTPPGSIAQVRNCTQRLVALAKSSGTALMLVGHVTKEGELAGPKTLEHLVDVVLALEGERFSPYRVLRSMKNRFGSTEEIGLFEMAEEGLREVNDPSSALLAGRVSGATGSVVTATLDGTRPLLVEIQALTSPTPFGMPRRNANGVDFNRLQMLLAVLSKRLDLPLGTQDVFVNVIGGLKVEEPAADLAIALALVSSVRNAPLPPALLAVGEVGLTGEVRAVPGLSKRLTEAARLGFQRVLAPNTNGASASGIDLTQVTTLREAARAAFS